MVNVGAGGAAAKRIVTGYTGLKQDVYTCLATEHYHKMFVLKGFDRVYEIGKHFNKESMFFILFPILIVHIQLLRCYDTYYYVNWYHNVYTS